MSTALDRSTLDQKDRTELQTIAEAMGGKPGSRTRKAEIIDMILDLAGVKPDEPSGDSSSGDTSEDTEAKDAEDKDTEDKDAEAKDAEAKDAEGQGSKQQVDTTPEAGNRRRRRRGRDRNRDDGQSEWDGTTTPVDGNLDLRDEGFGFVRLEGAMPSTKDIYVPVKLVRQFGLRRGDHLVGASRPANRNEKNPALVEVASVNGGSPEAALERPVFETLSAEHPSTRLTLERDDNTTGSAIDLIAPIGKGQRGLIVGPARSGKSAVLRDVGASVKQNADDVVLSVVLIGGRPEEASDWADMIDGDVTSSTFDQPREEHIAVAELAIERAKRMVEGGADVCVLIDGLSALVAAYNAVHATGEAVLGSGLDIGALEVALALFGSARNLGDAGSLTIIGTADADTGSDLDEAIGAELRRAANMELRLHASAAQARVFPAIDLLRSSTLRDDLLHDDVEATDALRRDLAALAANDNSPTAMTRAFVEQLDAAGSGAKLLKAVAKGGFKL